MRRVIGWSIPLVLIAFGLLWPLVFTGEHRGAARRRPGDVQQLQGRLPRQRQRQARRGGDHHRRVPRRAARHLPVLGHRQPEQPPGAADARDHLGAARRRTRAVPDAVGGRRAVPGGQDRRPGQVPRLRHPRLRDPLHRPRRPRPGHTGADKIRHLHRRATPPRRRCSSGTSSPPSWNNRIQQADITVTLPGDVTGAQCSVGFGVGAPCDDLTITGNKVALSTELSGIPHPGDPAGRGRCAHAAARELPWPYTWDRILGPSVTGLVWILA